jgi:hypothetical protein
MAAGKGAGPRGERGVGRAAAGLTGSVWAESWVSNFLVSFLFSFSNQLKSI